MAHPLKHYAAITLFLLLVGGCNENGPNPASAVPDPDTNPLAPRNRYSFNNKCFALKSAANNQYVAVAGAGYAANASAVTGAESFYLKPSALGEYLVYNSSGELMTAAIAASNPNGTACTPGQSLCNQPLDSAIDSSIFVVKAAGDATAYPPAPLFDVEPTVVQIAAYRNFVDPNILSVPFTLASKPDGRRLTSGAAGAITLAPDAGASNTQQFSFEALTSGCAVFPEAQNNAVGETFKGTYQGRVIGMADTHVHVTSTTFLGGAKAGFPFHKFGVTHAVGDCAYAHGEGGGKDGVGAAFIGDTNGHDTTGWPTFPDWPSRGALTHEAIYWKWLERAWLSGLRILVNDLVDNGTLCELQRNAGGPGSTSENCNEMQTAREQASTTYAMQDYIDAQYGGRGKGWWRVVWTPTEARQVITAGKLAVVMGVEITNLFDCQLTYNPNPTRKEPYQETGAGPGENTYKCAMTETGLPNEIKTQLDFFHELGMRQLISIHEFDTAFGGNGIFDGVILNLGNRENSGGNPTPGVPPNNPFDFAVPKETPTGEFWTTYNCPTESELDAAIPGDGYLWEESGGALMNKVGNNPQPPMFSPPACVFAGQGGRPGGTTNCYPLGKHQCNARWMTPIGLYMYKMLMEKGIIFDFDHMTIDMKTQALELAEAQTPPYPFVSTHGTFGGTTVEQARRVFKNGGHLYPSVGSSTGLLGDMQETRAVWMSAGSPYRTGLFGFGFGTDTNGLSRQAGPRSAERIAQDPLVYGYTLFRGTLFDQMPEFAALDDDNNPATPYAGVRFNQPEERNAAGEGRTWHADDEDGPGDEVGTGTAHAGMQSDLVEEIRLEAVAAARAANRPINTSDTQNMRDLFNAAEVYIQTWERTLASQAGILANDNGGKAKVPAGILRRAPTPSDPNPPE